MSDVTAFFLLLVTVYSLGSLQFGYHIGELNTPQAVISCNANGYTVGPHTNGFVDCIRMTDVQYGSIVSMFPIGGLIGSLFAGRLADLYGRKPVSIIDSLIFTIGSAIMSMSNSMLTLGTGRLVCGIASGASLVTVPIYLNEISPISIRGIVGVMTQLSCVFGILLAQIAGIYMSSVPYWRVILGCGAVLGMVQFLMFWSTVESPKWLASQPGRYGHARSILVRIRGRSDIQAEMKTWKIEDEDVIENDIEEQQELMRSPTENLSGVKQPLSFQKFMSNSRYRPAIKAIVLIQVAVGQFWNGKM